MRRCTKKVEKKEKEKKQREKADVSKMGNGTMSSAVGI